MFDKKLWFFICTLKHRGSLGRRKGESRGFVAEEVFFYCGSHQGKLRRLKKDRKAWWDCGLAQSTLRCSQTVRNWAHRNAFIPHATEEKSTLHYTKQSCYVAGVCDEETRQTSVSTRVERSRGSVIAQHLGVCAAWLHGFFPMKRGQAERGSSRYGSKWPWRKKQHCGLLQPREVWKHA